jgi:probable F420-dependent oxidoreductase
MSLEGLRARGLNVGRLAASGRHMLDVSPAEAKAHARAIEDAGITNLWYGETWGPEAFTFAQRILNATERLVVGSGIVRALERSPKNAASAQWTILQEFPNRYILGLGASGDTRKVGKSPVQFMRDYLAELDQHTERLTGSSTRYPRIQGAYSPGTTKIGRDLCDGITTALITAEHTAWARELLGPEPFLTAGVDVCVTNDIKKFREHARKLLEYYLPLPHQINKYKNLGFSEEDYAPPGSDHLIDRLMAGGPIDVVAERLREHLKNGADQVHITFLGATPAEEIEHLGELNRMLG